MELEYRGINNSCSKTGFGLTAYEDICIELQFDLSNLWTPVKESLDVSEMGTIYVKMPPFVRRLYPCSMNNVYESKEPFCTPAMERAVINSRLK